MLVTVLIILLVLAVFGSLPLYSHSKGWGYMPSGLLGTIVLVFIIGLVLRYMGYVRF